jgi:hypothetical protein
MRCNLWAGAGSGKSVAASFVYSALKQKKYNIELAGEFIKAWAYEGKIPKSFDQVFVFGSQVHTEDTFLQAGVDHVITDSPVLMQIFYARKYNFPCWQSLLEVAQAFETTYPSLNIFLDREGIEYKSEGRYEDEAQAKANDSEMKSFMECYLPEYKVLRSIDLDKIVEYVEKAIKPDELIPRKVGWSDKFLKKFFT